MGIGLGRVFSNNAPIHWLENKYMQPFLRAYMTYEEWNLLALGIQ
jgi:hypothetical protein